MTTIALTIPNNKTMVIKQVNLERQMGQLAEEVHKREAGKLPSYPALNPKHKPGGPKHVNMFQRKLKETLPKKIDLTEHVSAVLSSSLPPKFKDPRAPLILVVMGNIAINKALIDLDASINILHASLTDKCDLGTIHKIDTIISLADRSTKIPKGILEDVIVKVDNFYYPVDFFVMDTESPYKDVQPTIILGRPFLATIDAKINYQTGAMDITFGNKKLRLNVFIYVNSPTMNECYQVDVIDEEVQKHAPRMLKDDPLDLKLQLNVFNSLNSPILNDCYHIDTIDKCIQTHTPSMNLDRTLENLHCVDSEKELFDGKRIIND
ncbi:putative nucleotidyltransferase, ribonuclease H [Tanacetum coccineum]